jgi:general secretion pathway protein G
LIATRSKESGFTLIELVITTAIIGLLASLAVPMLGVISQRQKENELRTALRQIRSAIDAYHDAGIEGKIDRSADTSGYPPNLLVLEKGVPDITKPNRPLIFFLRKLPRDPFTSDSSMSAAQTWGKRSYASPSNEPKEGDDVFDVYSLAPGAGLNGVPYKEW